MQHNHIQLYSVFSFIARIAFCFVLTVSFVITSLQKSDAATLSINSNSIQNGLSLLPYLEYLSDPSGSLTINSLSAPGQQNIFRPFSQGQTARLSGTTWLRLTILSPDKDTWGRHLRLDLGTETPAGAMLYEKMPGVNDSQGSWATHKAMDNSIFVFRNPSVPEAVIYLRLPGAPGLWFAPTLSSAGPVAAQSSPLVAQNNGMMQTAVAIALILVTLLAFLRAFSKGGEWRIWTGIISILALTIFCIPVPVMPKNIMTVWGGCKTLAAGLALLIFFHTGRHMMRTMETRPAADALLRIFCIAAAILTIYSFIPGQAWFLRYTVLWPLLAVAGIIPAFLCFSRMSYAASRYLLASILLCAGAIMALSAIGKPVSDAFMVNAPYWAVFLACCIMAIPGLNKPKQKNSAHKEQGIPLSIADNLDEESFVSDVTVKFPSQKAMEFEQNATLSLQECPARQTEEPSPGIQSGSLILIEEEKQSNPELVADSETIPLVPETSSKTKDDFLSLEPTLQVTEQNLSDEFILDSELVTIPDEPTLPELEPVNDHISALGQATADNPAAPELMFEDIDTELVVIREPLQELPIDTEQNQQDEKIPENRAADTKYRLNFSEKATIEDHTFELQVETAPLSHLNATTAFTDVATHEEPETNINPDIDVHEGADSSLKDAQGKEEYSLLAEDQELPQDDTPLIPGVIEKTESAENEVTDTSEPFERKVLEVSEEYTEEPANILEPDQKELTVLPPETERGLSTNKPVQESENKDESEQLQEERHAEAVGLNESSQLKTEEALKQAALVPLNEHEPIPAYEAALINQNLEANNKEASEDKALDKQETVTIHSQAQQHIEPLLQAIEELAHDDSLPIEAKTKLDALLAAARTLPTLKARAEEESSPDLHISVPETEQDQERFGAAPLQHTISNNIAGHAEDETPDSITHEESDSIQKPDPMNAHSEDYSITEFSNEEVMELKDNEPYLEEEDVLEEEPIITIPRTLLVADSLAADRQVFGFFLEGLPFTVIEARNLDEARARYKFNPTSIVLIEPALSLRGMESTISFFHKLDEEAERIPAPIVALVSEPEQAERMLDAGCADTLLKPLSRKATRRLMLKLALELEALEEAYAKAKKEREENSSVPKAPEVRPVPPQAVTAEERTALFSNPEFLSIEDNEQAALQAEDSIPEDVLLLGARRTDTSSAAISADGVAQFSTNSEEPETIQNTMNLPNPVTLEPSLAEGAPEQVMAKQTEPKKEQTLGSIDPLPDMEMLDEETLVLLENPLPEGDEQPHETNDNTVCPRSNEDFPPDTLIPVFEEDALTNSGETISYEASQDTLSVEYETTAESQFPVESLQEQQLDTIPISGMITEGVDRELVPLIPELIKNLTTALRNATQGKQDNDPELVKNACQKISSTAGLHGLKVIQRIAACVERAAEAKDREAIADLLSELELTVTRNVKTLERQYARSQEK